MVSDLILSNFSEHVRLNETEKEQLLSVLIARPFKRGELVLGDEIMLSFDIQLLKQ